MKTKIRILICYILRKIYPLLHQIQMEQENREDNMMFSSFKLLGKNVSIKRPYIISGVRFVQIGDNFNSMPNLRLEAISKYGNQQFIPQIIIGDNVSCQANCHIASINEVKIGSGTMIASNVFITDHFHGTIVRKSLNTPPALRSLFSKGPVRIGKNVWIGDGVCIMPNVMIGNNVIIGANSVVTKSFSSNVVIAGNPAKIIKRLDELA